MWCAIFLTCLTLNWKIESNRNFQVGEALHLFKYSSELQNLKHQKCMLRLEKQVESHPEAIRRVYRLRDRAKRYQISNTETSGLQLQRFNFPDVSSRLLCVTLKINLDDLPGNQCMTGEENQWGATHMVRHLGFGQSSCALRSWSSGFGSKLNRRSVIPTVHKKGVSGWKCNDRLNALLYLWQRSLRSSFFLGQKTQQREEMKIGQMESPLNARCGRFFSVGVERSYPFICTHQPHHFSAWTDFWRALYVGRRLDGHRMTGFELCSKAGEIHRTAEASDRPGTSVAAQSGWLIDDHHYSWSLWNISDIQRWHLMTWWKRYS